MEYKCILMDPPWMERGGGKIKRGADRHYPLLHAKEMPRVIYQSGFWSPAADCHLWMWTTNNYLPDAMWLIKALGFRYITNAVWVKERAGLGQYLRGQHELLLFAVRGSGPKARTDRKDLRSVIHAPRTEHSKKPEQSYQLIESRSMAPRLEMFAREERTGWDNFGNSIKPLELR